MSIGQKAKTSAKGLIGGLTQREKRFCDAWMRHGNATRAIRQAGYQCANDNSAACLGSQMLNKEHIVEYIARATWPGVEAITPAYIMEAIHLEAVTAEHAGSRVRALELLGKTFAMFIEKHQHEHERHGDADMVRDIAAGNPVVAAALIKKLTGGHTEMVEKLLGEVARDEGERATIQADLRTATLH